MTKTSRLSDLEKVECWAPVEKTARKKIKHSAALVNMPGDRKKSSDFLTHTH